MNVYLIKVLPLNANIHKLHGPLKWLWGLLKWAHRVRLVWWSKQPYLWVRTTAGTNDSTVEIKLRI